MNVDYDVDYHTFFKVVLQERKIRVSYALQ